MRERKVGLNGATKMKQDEFRRKVKQEFAKLKLYEIAGVAYATLGTYYIGKFFCDKFPRTFPINGQINNWFNNWILGMLFNFILAFLLAFGYLWIQKNWAWAEERVKKRGK